MLQSSKKCLGSVGCGKTMTKIRFLLSIVSLCYSSCKLRQLCIYKLNYGNLIKLQNNNNNITIYYNYKVCKNKSMKKFQIIF